MSKTLSQSIATRVMLAFAGAALAFGAAAGISLNRLGAVNTAAGALFGAESAGIETTDAWIAVTSEARGHARDMLILEDKAQIKEEGEKMRSLAEKGRTYAESSMAQVDVPAEKALFQEVLDAGTKLAPLDEQFLIQTMGGNVSQARETLQQARAPELALEAALAKLKDYQAARIREQASALQSGYQQTRTLVLTFWLAAAALAVLLAWQLARSIKLPLQQALAVLSDIGKEHEANTAAVRSNDELGEMRELLERVRTALDRRSEREQDAALQYARIRTALDRVSVGALLEDSEGTVIYMNEAMHALVRSQAQEIRQAIPSFDPEQLLGHSFDVFQQVEALHQQRLNALAAAQTADVKMGAASFRIMMCPIGCEGKRVGTLIQWVDRTQEVATEEEVHAAVEKAIDGDLTVRIREEGKEAFFKVLAGGMNRVLENMANVVRSMAQASAEVRTGAEEISRGNSELSQRTEQQASSLEETASSMEQMTATVRKNADHAAQANDLTAAAREQAERGGAVLSAAIAAMGEINASSKRIADIIGVIDEIAFQTNLLALNAAVEAARAGEQGRGFAVVASEVRNLASRSAAAAKEIKALIQDSLGKVTEGTKLVDDSGKALGDIVNRVEKVTEVMAQILSSSREQAAGIEQVNQAITTIDDMTQQNAALVEEAAAAAQALTEQASTLAQLITGYRAEGASPQAAVPARSVQVPAAPFAERRSPNRPLSGKKKPPVMSITSKASRSAAAEAEEWKDF